jgi:hypothetical protein
MSLPVPKSFGRWSCVLLLLPLAVAACGSDGSTGGPSGDGGGASVTSHDGGPVTDGATGSDGPTGDDASSTGNDASSTGDAGGNGAGQICSPSHDTCAAPLKCCPTNLPAKSTCQTTDSNGLCAPHP